MITAQDIREKVFDRSRFNGYEMTAVDDFLEELANEVAAAQKENKVLNSKLKVLVEKIEEYRANEDAANKVLLSAQKLAIQIEDDARARAEAIISAAEKQSKDIIGSISDRKTEEENKLAQAQEATAKYFAAVRALCNAQLTKLDEVETGYVPEELIEQAAAEEETDADAALEETIRTIEDSVANSRPEIDVDIDLSDILAQSEE